MYRLAKELNVPHPFAIGVITLLWEFASSNTPRGDIGSVPEKVIAEKVGWLPRKPKLLIDALVGSGWLDRHTEYGLVIHDWADHCEFDVCRLLERTGKDFLPLYGKSIADRGSSVARPRKSRDPAMVIPRENHASREAMAKALASEKASGEKSSNRDFWREAGFEGPEHFDTWWNDLVRKHPNRNKNASAKSALYPLIIAGKFNRVEFERGYSDLREAAGENWTKDGGFFATNLWEIVENELWRYAPLEPQSEGLSPALRQAVKELEQEGRA